MAEQIADAEARTLQAVKDVSARRRPAVEGHAIATEVAKVTRQSRDAERARLKRLGDRRLLSVKAKQPIKATPPAQGARYVSAFRVNRNGDRALSAHRRKAATA